MSSVPGAGAGVTFFGTGAGVKKCDSDHLCATAKEIQPLQPLLYMYVPGAL